MKKILAVLFMLSLALVVSACSQKKEAIPNPITDPAGNISGMVDLKNNAEKNIQDSEALENERLNNTLNENNMNSSQNAAGDNSELVKKYTAATIKTSLGDIKVKFDSTSAPVTVGNFLKLSQSKFYDGTKFHRVIKGFMIQGGDPFSKDNTLKERWGTGDPGYTLPAEIKLKNTRGSIATARQSDQVNPEKRSSGSQFYINTVNNISLDGAYTVFGEVVSGMDVADKIENVKTGASDRPVEDVVIQSVEVLEK